ncbi:FtsK/SpoIIIE domain-containing protein [Lysinibacillus sp. NPDC086135]|uniref:FtsK/SpoIIIE domain-containing protein n=1 Tax=Lysinibacillus sp. NPDC086135 TaxID=3364130 RepID=UPI0038233556
MSLKRLINPSVTSNEKYSNYNIESLTMSTIKEILSNSFIDGVFGVEAFRIANGENYTFFSQPNYNCKLTTIRNNSAHYLNSNSENTTFVQLYMSKPSMFPIEMNTPTTFLEIINSIIPSHINYKYQLLLVYRQDNWRDRIVEQYNDYLNGVQNPSDNGLLRKIQRSITEKIDELLRWEQKHSEIKEVGQKLKENGFRFNIRLALIGGSKLEREYSLSKIEYEINKYSYTNEWLVDHNIDFKHGSEMFNNRVLDYQSKNHTLSESELLQFIVLENKTQINENASLIEKKVEENESESNNLIKLLPKGNGIKQFDGNDLADKFIFALRELKPFRGNLEMIKCQSGSTSMKITLKIPKHLKFSEINKPNIISDIQIKMGVKHLQIKQGIDVGEIDIILPLEKRQKLFLADYINNEEFKEFADNHPLPFLVGVDEVGSPIYSCMSTIKHLLVAGSTGSGKSVWLNQLILTLLIYKNPSELQLFMIDIKQVELVQFSSFNHVQSVITEANEAVKLLNQLITEMNRRYELFKNAGVKNIRLYNKKSKNKLPYILCIIDEYAELTSRNGDIHSYIQSLTQLSRACGIHLIIATQRPSIDVISGTIKSNLPSKIGFRCANKRSYLTFLNTSPKFELLGNGDGVMDFEGQSEEHMRFQGALIVDDPNDEDLESKLINKVANQIKHEKVKIELPEVEELKEENDLDKLKRVIVDTGETRVSPLRSIMKININKLNDLMRDLVEDGWMEAPITKQSGYKLIVSEEEMEKWRR